MDRLHQIAKEIEELDRQAVGNEMYQKASKLYLETTIIQTKDIEERNQLMTNFVEQHKQLKQFHEEMVQLNDIMYDFIVANGLLSRFQEYFQPDETKVLN